MYRKKIIELILNKNKGVSQKMNKKSIMRISFISLFFSIITACSLINVSSSNNLSEISQKEFNNAIKSLNLSSGEKPTVLDIGNGMAVISTADFFMPIFGDSFDCGRIAAVNAISDIYAVCGKPALAIAILGWPS